MINLSVEMNVTTWTKDSHGLYDYQAQPQQYRKEVFYLDIECKLFRDPTSKYMPYEDTTTFIQSCKDERKIIK